ncbi:MAG: tetratricopeptide repeat protein [Kiritimatiellia bacterium]|jgi:TolA-binding protein
MKKTLLLAVLALASVSAFANVRARIFKVGDDRPLQGTVIWRAIAKQYILTQPNGVEITIDFADVARIQVEKPREFDGAVSAVKSGKFAAAIPVLEKLVKDYAMLQWDEEAIPYLAEAYLATGRDADAVKECEKVIALKPEAAYSGDMAMSYWTALLKTGKTAKLDELVEKAAKSGQRSNAARALVMRGDILAARNQHREALEDGYLRVIVLYASEKNLQPEALFKAAQSFEALQQVPHAERMRTKLRTEYPSSEYVRKL